MRGRLIGARRRATEQPQRRSMQRWTGSLAAMAVIGASLAVAPAAQAAPPPENCDETGSCSVTFQFTGASIAWEAPAGATDVGFVVVGGSGQGGSATRAGLGGGINVAANPAIVPGTDFVIAVGQGGQGVTGGWGGGGNGGAQGNATYAGQGGGGGSYVFIDRGGSYEPYAIAGGGSGGSGQYAGMQGGGRDFGGLQLTGNGGSGGYGGAGTPSGPGAGGHHDNVFMRGGGAGTGPAAFTGTLVFGQGGAGGDAGIESGETGAIGSGSGGGGGYYGGGGASGGLDASSGPFTGHPGGGGSGYLAPEATGTSTSQSPLSLGESRNGYVTVNWRILADADVTVEAADVSAAFGETVTLVANVSCSYGAENGAVRFIDDETEVSLGAVNVNPITQAASLVFTPSGAGTHHLTVHYGGRGGLCGTASDSLVVTVAAAPSALQNLMADPATLAAGSSTTLSARVACAAPLAGELVFTRGGAEIGRAPIDPSTGEGRISYRPTSAGDAPVVVTFESATANCASVLGDSHQIALSVAAPASNPQQKGGDGLARTGSGDAAMLGIGVALVALGTALTLAYGFRRRLS